MRMPYDNLNDITKLKGGSARFTYNNLACVGIIDEIEYIPLGAGAIKAKLSSARTVDGNQPICEEGDLFELNVSCFMSVVESRLPRELVINTSVDEPPFGQFFSFHVKE